jgi:hypothetical protein
LPTLTESFKRTTTITTTRVATTGITTTGITTTGVALTGITTIGVTTTTAGIGIITTGEELMQRASGYSARSSSCVVISCGCLLARARPFKNVGGRKQLFRSLSALHSETAAPRMLRWSSFWMRDQKMVQNMEQG